MLDVKKFKIHEIGIEKVSHFTHCRLHLLPTLFVGTANWFWHRHTPTLANICNQHFQTWPRPLIHWNQQRQQFCHMCPKTIDSKFLGLVLAKKKKKKFLGLVSKEYVPIPFLNFILIIIVQLFMTLCITDHPV